MKIPIIFTIFGIRTKLRIKKQQRIEQQRFDVWKAANPGNLIDKISGCLSYENIKVGKYSYGSLNIRAYRSFGKLIIGNFVSIADGVRFLFNSNHHLSRIMTYPLDSKITQTKNYEDNLIDGDIRIDDDVWIGLNAVIFSDVTIGKGAVIGVGAIITKDVPPYAIVAGNPAKIIRYRFPQPVIDKLMQIDYSKFDAEFIRQHLSEFYSENEEMEAFIEQLMTIQNK